MDNAIPNLRRRVGGAPQLQTAAPTRARHSRDVEMLKLFTNGWRHAEIAKHFGLSASHCYQRITATKKAILDAALDGDNLMMLSRNFGLSPEITADYVREEGNKRRDRLIRAYYSDPNRPDEISSMIDHIYNVVGDFYSIAPPETTRGERRKSLIAAGA